MVGKPQSPMGLSESAPSLLETLAPIAEQFQLPGAICQIEPLGEGNVNDTYRVRCQVAGQADGQHFVLQRINTTVFTRPDLVMHNMLTLSQHINSQHPQGQQLEGQHPQSQHIDGHQRDSIQDLGEERWLTPQPIESRSSEQPWIEQDGQFWRVITFVDGATTLQRVDHPDQALQVGTALGRFHSLVHDLPADQLADTLPGFHVTPGYLRAYHQVLAQVTPLGQLEGLEPIASGPNANQVGPLQVDPLSACLEFIRQREDELDILEMALQRGELVTRVIHGDPKVNNILFCANSGKAIAMVDLDTVKPGLLHYDIGDCCRSGCNPAGEETTDLDAVVFDLELCEATLQGYLTATKGTLRPQDFDYLFAAIRLIPLELGLRFLTDHLAGNPYFKVKRPGHNLDRARVQFKLTQSIEQQADQIYAIIDRLRQTICP